jgi:hypothetical protein
MVKMLALIYESLLIGRMNLLKRVFGRSSDGGIEINICTWSTTKFPCSIFDFRCLAKS